MLSPKEAFEFFELLTKGHGKMFDVYDGYGGGAGIVAYTFILRRPFSSVTELKTFGLTSDFVSEYSYCYTYNSRIRDLPYKGTFVQLEFQFTDGDSFEEFLTNPLNVPFFDIAKSLNIDSILYNTVNIVHTDAHTLSIPQREICEEIWERYHS